MYLEKIKSPKDIKGLNIKELNDVAGEIRQGILNRVSNHGGHVGPNLGFVEATIALHYVFNAPEDKIVFDVSHQSYPHKMLTGRADGFLHVEDMNAISGYSSPRENAEYDNFEIGHTSTSIALATGLQKGRDILGGKENVIAVIGDGSLSGGEAFEGFDTAAEIGTNIIIVVNDNEMSIAENHGGLYRNLQLLRETKGKAECNFFRAMGFDYRYVEQGNDIAALIAAFREVKDIDHPVVVHIHTEKGHGYEPAVENKEAWHWHMPFYIADGSLRNTDDGENIDSLLGDWLFEKMKKDPKLVLITAGTPSSFGFNKARREAAGRQFIDAGIAEEEAVALASGAAKRGAHPVFSDYATFFQRTYDQLAQDLAVNGNPAVFNILGATIYGMNDFTHICFFDIPMISHIPNLHYLAPTTYEELIAMENWAINQEKYSVAIRVPAGKVCHATEPVDTDYSDINRFRVAHRGSDVAIIAVGNFFQKGERVRELLTGKGIDATLVNPRWLSGIDEDLLADLKKNHRLVITLEDGSLDGGFGERVSRFYGPTEVRVLNFGVKKSLYDRYDVNELLRENHLEDGQIVADIMSLL
ncbi:1-deoxy-D-xylulose-5-phosphate synthase [Prevotella sp. AGR2160]|uniref:1-deoxy-D-xylulose-5-phosphate synthase n=1 Tax=Prevotella sp. AGR2160 TaxID=1280674 RepID=UPI00041BB8B8|nr:1-deoxy-D-xylulose-5-phosphate synthase [Prevotella sp. AGR2160]